MRTIVLAIIILLPLLGFSQKKSEIIQLGIKVKRFYEQDLSDGEKEAYLYKEEFYDFRGELVELKEYKDQGDDLDKWVKYKYDNSGNLIEEIELDADGGIKSREVSVYKDGLRIEKQYYDDRDRLETVKKYEYEFRQ